MEASTVGTWAQIGYNAPGKANGSNSSSTTNFGYGDSNSSGKQVWTATAKVNLNDCKVGDTWTASASAEHSAADGTTYVYITTGGTDACTGLTPSFANLARSSN